MKDNSKSLWRKVCLTIVAVAGTSLAVAQPDLKIGYASGGGSTLTSIGRDAGLFEKVGVQNAYILFQSSGDGLNAQNVGKIDLSVSFGTGAPLTYASKGAKFVIIGGSLTGGHPIITKPENASRFKRIEDFKGSVVGSPRIYTSDVVFRGALINAGIDPEKDLKIVPFKRPVDVLEAVKSGKVEVGIGATPILGRAVASGLAIPLYSNDLFPDHPCCRIVATEDAIREKRDAVVKYLKGIILAERLWNTDRERGVRAVSKVQNLPYELAKEQTTNPNVKFYSNPNRKGVEAMYHHMRKINYIEKDVDLKRVIDTSLWRDALSELEKEIPGDPFWDVLEARWKSVEI